MRGTERNDLSSVPNQIRLIDESPAPEEITRGNTLGERSAKYRRFAEECLLMAASAEEELARAALKFMAQVWLRLAQEREVAGSVPNDEIG
jgi:hypothetical protein